MFTTALMVLKKDFQKFDKKAMLENVVGFALTRGT